MRQSADWTLSFLKRYMEYLKGTDIGRLTRDGTGGINQPSDVCVQGTEQVVSINLPMSVLKGYLESQTNYK